MEGRAESAEQRGEPAPDGAAGRGSRSLERRAVDRSLLRSSAAAGRPSSTGDGRPVASVVVIDDHGLLCDIIVTTLAYEGFQAASVPPTSVSAVIDGCDRRRPTLALLDLDLGCPEFNGFDLIGPLVDRAMDVVVLSGSQNRLLQAASLEAGAKAMISKGQPFPVMLDTVRLAARGQLVTDPSTRDALSRALRQHRESHAERLAPFGQLSPREREVLALLIEGCSAEVIAATCFVSVATVRSQIRAVLTKLRVNSQLGAVAAAKRSGWSPSIDTPLVRYSSTLWI